MRSLKQYKDLPEEEFDKLYEEKTTGIISSQDFEKKIQEKLDSFEEDYDLDDLKINDRMLLRSLAQSVIHLEDLEQKAFVIRLQGITEGNILLFEKLNNSMSNLKRDISKIQDDLKITRRIRKGDDQESVIAYIENLKVKARKFYESRTDYIFCPKCNILLGTVWTLYPYAKNKITLTCNRDLGDGINCDGVVTITTKELKEKRGFNKPELIPEALK